jgi:outer membrane autotransporter protein
MDNKKIKNLQKKLLLATLAASSTLSAFEAGAATDLSIMGGGAVGLNAGLNSVNLNSKLVATPDLAGLGPLTIFLNKAAGPMTFNNAAQALGATINILGTTGKEIVLAGDIDGTKTNTLIIINDFTDSMLTRAGYATDAGAAAVNTDALALTAGKNMAGTTANATSNLKIDVDNRQVINLSLDTIAKVGEVNFQGKNGANFGINFGAASRDLVTDTSNFTISTKFFNVGANSKVEVKSGTEWVALKNDASNVPVLVTAGNVLINENSTRPLSIDDKGTAYILAGKTLTGTVDGAVADKGTLILEGGNVTGNIGTTKALAVVTHTGDSSTITGDFNAKVLNLGGNVGKNLVITGTFNPANTTVNVTNNGAGLELKTIGNLAGFTLGREVSNTTLVLNDAGSLAVVAGTGTAVNSFMTTKDLNQSIHFKANNTLVVAKDHNLLGAVTTLTKNTGSIQYDDNAVISANVGEEDKALTAVVLNGPANAVHAINSGVKVYAPVIFTKSDSQTLNIGSGAFAHSIEGNRKNTLTVNVAAGASLGNVEDLAGKSELKGNVNFVGGGNLTGESYKADQVTFDGGLFQVNNGSKDVAINNLVTKNNAIIDSNGSALKFEGASTKIADGTTLSLTAKDSALELNGQTAANIGQTTLVVSTSSIIKLENVAYNQLVTPGYFGQFNLVTGVDSQDVYNKFSLANNSLVTFNSTYDATGQNLKITPDVNTNYISSIGTVVDGTKPLSLEAIATLSATSSTDDIIAKVAAPQSEYTDSATLAYITNGAQAALDAIVHPGSDRAVVGAGEDYNEMGITAFVTPFMANGTTKVNGQIAGSKLNVSGASFGASVGLNEDQTHLGLAITLANSTTKYKDQQQGNKLKGETKAVTLFGDQVLGNNFVLQSILTLGVTDYKSTQNLNSGEFAGKYTAKFGSLLAKLGYNMNTGSNVKVMPYVGLRYDTFKEDSYNLARGNTKVAVSGKTTNKYIASLGTKFSSSIEYDETHFAPFADVNFGYNFGKKSSAKNVDLGNFVINPEYASKDKTLVSGSLGLDANIKNGLNVNLAGRMDILGSKTTVYSGSLKLGYKF